MGSMEFRVDESLGSMATTTTNWISIGAWLNKSWWAKWLMELFVTTTFVAYNASRL
jgi:hypothetical protein